MVIETVKLRHTSLRGICREWARVLPATDVGTEVVLFLEGIPETLLDIAGDRRRIPITREMADELRDTGHVFYQSPDRSFETFIVLEG